MYFPLSLLYSLVWLAFVEVFDPLGVVFFHGDKHGPIFILLHVDSQLCQYHLLNMLSVFPFYVIFFFDKNQVFIGMWINIWVFNSVPLVLLSVFMPIPGLPRQKNR